MYWSTYRFSPSVTYLTTSGSLPLTYVPPPTPTKYLGSMASLIHCVDTCTECLPVQCYKCLGSMASLTHCVDTCTECLPVQCYKCLGSMLSLTLCAVRRTEIQPEMLILYNRLKVEFGDCIVHGLRCMAGQPWDSSYFAWCSNLLE